MLTRRTRGGHVTRVGESSIDTSAASECVRVQQGDKNDCPLRRWENLIMGYVVGLVDDTSCCLGSLNGVAAEGGVLRIWLLGCRV